MTALNSKQLALLKLIHQAGPAGAIVTGRGPAETAIALSDRGLVARIGGQQSIVMDRLGVHPIWRSTSQGGQLLAERAKAPNSEVRS